MSNINIPFAAGGGGDFKPSFFSGEVSIGTGQSGTFITLTPPAGKKVRLTLLIATGTTEPSIAVANDIGTIITGTVRQNNGAGFGAGSFMVTAVGGLTDLSSQPALTYVESSVDGQITIEKTTGSTVSTLYYAYAYGD